MLIAVLFQTNFHSCYAQNSSSLFGIWLQPCERNINSATSLPPGPFGQFTCSKLRVRYCRHSSSAGLYSTKPLQHKLQHRARPANTTAPGESQPCQQRPLLRLRLPCQHPRSAHSSCSTRSARRALVLCSACSQQCPRYVCMCHARPRSPYQHSQLCPPSMLPEVPVPPLQPPQRAAPNVPGLDPGRVQWSVKVAQLPSDDATML